MKNFKRMVAIFFSLAMILAFIPALTLVSFAESTSLPEAQDGVITLTEDVTLSSTVYVSSDTTLDLNGYTLTSNASSNVGAFYLNNSNSKLTVMSSKDGGTIATTSSKYGIYACNSGSSVIMQSGTLTASNSNDGVTAVQVSSGASFEMTGGSIEATAVKTATNWRDTAKNAYCLNNSGTAVISGGDIIANTNGINYAVSNSGTLTVSGGNITASNEKNTGSAPYAVYVTGGNAEVTGGTITIYDKDTYGWSEGHLVYGTASVSGGTFISSKALDIQELERKIASGYILVDNQDGSYTVVPEPTYVAQIGQIKYATLAEAIAAVSTEDSVIEITGDTTFAGVDLKDGDAIKVTSSSSEIEGSQVAAKEVTIEQKDESKLTIAYVVSDGSNSAVITAVSKDSTVEAEGKTAVSDFVKVADVLAGAVAENNIDVSTITSMELSLSKTPEDSSTDEEIQSIINAGGVAFEVHPVATITTTSGAGTHEETYPVTNAELTDGAKFTFSLSLGDEYANKKVKLTHYKSNNTTEDLGEFTANASGVVSGIELSSFSVITAEIQPNSVASYVDNNDDTKYTDDLATAIANVKARGTVTLLKDVSLTSTQNITKDLTIDLNGHNITATDARALWIQSGEVTITGEGNISTAVTAGTALSDSSSVIRVGSSGATAAKLTVGSDVTVATDYCYGITAFGTNTNGVDLIVNGTVTVTGSNAAISGNGNSGNKGAVTINSGAIVSAANDVAIYHPQKDYLTINGGTITGPTAVYVKSGNVSITGGTLHATGAAAEYSYNGNGSNATGDALVVDNCNYPGGAPTVEISAGTFSSDHGKGIGSYTGAAAGATPPVELAEVTANSNSITLPDNEMWVETSTSGEYEIGKAVAKIGNTSYATLEAAFAAVPADGTETTIVMVADYAFESNNGVTVAKTQNIVLDLNGHKITQTVPEVKASYLITNKGTLTITDNSQSKDGEILAEAKEDVAVGSSSFTYGNYTIENNGTLNVQGGTVRCNLGGGACYAVDNNSSAASAILNLSDGTIVSDRVAVRQFCNSTTYENQVNVTGGTIYGVGSTGLWIQLPGSDSSKAVKASLSVTDGEIKTDKEGGYAFYDYSYGNAYNSVNYDIDGGSFDGYVFSYGANTEISGGTFKDGVYIKDSDNVEISGATFYDAVKLYGECGNIDISDGTFNAYVYLYSDNVSVSGGNFNDWVCLDTESKYENMSISGGDFYGVYDYGDGGDYISGGVYTVEPNETIIVPTKAAQVKDESGRFIIGDAVAQIDDIGYATLPAAVIAANKADSAVTIKMLMDTQISAGQDITGNVTLDLNGKTITNTEDITTDYLFGVKHGGTLRVNDTATSGGGKISMSKSYCAIKMTVTGETDETNPANLIVNAGTIEGKDFGISGNGSTGRGNVNITVNGGIVRNTKTNGTGDDAAIYMPNTGTVTLNGGTITGLTGVELRSGTLNIPATSSVTITGTGNPANYNGNNNGTTTYGAGIAIAQHTTDHDINVAIAGGNISGAYALAVVNPNGRTGDNMTVAVSGGTFVGTGTDKKALQITDTRVSKFVSGGSFSEQVITDYCADGYKPETQADENGLYSVVPATSQVKYTATLTLADNINVNFYIKNVTEKEAAKYKVEYSFAGGADTLTPVYVAGQSKCKAIIPDIYSYQMGKPINITVKYTSGGSTQVVKETTYSVSTYFHNMINKYDGVEGYENEVKLYKAGLDYGANAQLYFNGKSYIDELGNTVEYDTDPDDLVNADTNPGNSIAATQPDKNQYKTSRTGGIDGITRYSAALVLGSETSLKLFMTGDVSGVTVSCTDSQGKDRTVSELKHESDGRYSFKINGIKSFELYRTYTITISRGSESTIIKYSPYTFATNNWDNTDMGKVVQSFVAYGDAAKILWPDN